MSFVLRESRRGVREGKGAELAHYMMRRKAIYHRPVLNTRCGFAWRPTDIFASVVLLLRIVWWERREADGVVVGL